MRHARIGASAGKVCRVRRDTSFTPAAVSSTTAGVKNSHTLVVTGKCPKLDAIQANSSVPVSQAAGRTVRRQRAATPRTAARVTSGATWRPRGNVLNTHTASTYLFTTANDAGTSGAAERPHPR